MEKVILLLLFAVLYCGVEVQSEEEDHDVHWGYADGKESQRPENWYRTFPKCGGKKQSPINLVTAKAKFSDILQENPLTLHGYDDNSIAQSNVHLYNNGHTATVSVDDGSLKPIGVYNGGLPYHYALLQFHWHWGRVHMQGSEHTMDGKAYPAELHFVHVSSWYNDVETALEHSDGLAVLGVFMEIGEHNNDMDIILDKFEHSSQEGHNQTSIRIDLPSLKGLLPKNMSQFYRYQGSLTTPPCSEAVIWTVFKNTIQVSEAQIRKFRTLLLKDKSTSGNRTPTSSSNIITDNYRPVQPLNDRNVYASFIPDSTETLLELHKWSYDGSHGSPAPADWGTKYGACAGRKQSPIHIKHDAAIPSPLMSNQPWVLTNYDKTPENFQVNLENNGHTVVAEVTEGLTVSGGGLPTAYKLLQFHLHWGSESVKGSEHVLDGKHYPAELHLVHANKLYKNFDQVFNNQDGLAVLGILIDVGDHNKAFDPIIEKLDDIKYITDSEHVHLKLPALRPFLPDDINEFYRYHGSLTTPPCHEAVVWTVFKNPITMSEAQLEKLRTKLYNMHAPNMTNIVSETSGSTNAGAPTPSSTNNHGNNDNSQDSSSYKPLVIDNYRPIQEIYDRVVRYGKIVPQKQVSGARALTGSLLSTFIALISVNFFLIYL